MARFDAPHGRIEYEVEGSGRPLVLICGLGSQLIRWSAGFRGALVKRGFQVVRFDNRDAGLSHNYSEGPTPDLKEVIRATKAGEMVDLPYRLPDLANDVVLLMDHLGITRADILGVSMGGFIAQHLAATHPERVAALTLIMTSTGNPALPRPSTAAQEFMTRRGRAEGNQNDDAIEQAVASALAICSPAYPPDIEALRARVTAEIKRSFLPSGYVRQRAAILADGDRSKLVERILAPTLVIHGTSDPLIPCQGGEELAALIRHSELRLYNGMGHEIPEALASEIADAIVLVGTRARHLK